MLELRGTLPSVCVIYTDESCRIIDEDAYREHVRNLLQEDIGALVVGGHAGETECLSMPERRRVLEIAKDEAMGRVPVVGGVISDSTWGAIEQGHFNVDAGADAVLFCAPSILGWDAQTGYELLVEHLLAFEREVDIPVIFFGGPYSDGTYCYGPRVFKEIGLRSHNVVAWKIVARYDLGVFRSCVNALRSAEEQTGRHIAPLLAGDWGLVESVRCGGEGNLNGGGNYRAAEDAALYNAAKEGNYTKGFEIEDRIQPITDAIRGIYPGKPSRSITYFHYRYKVAAWLRGFIPRPHMRRPQLPVPLDEVRLMRQALMDAGMNPVHEAEELRTELAAI